MQLYGGSAVHVTSIWVISYVLPGVQRVLCLRAISGGTDDLRALKSFGMMVNYPSACIPIIPPGVV